MVVITWFLDLQLPVQLMSSKTKVVSSNPAHAEVYLLQHNAIKVCQWLAAGHWFSPVSASNKTDGHNITEILLKVALPSQH